MCKALHGYRGRHARECLPKDWKTAQSFSAQEEMGSEQALSFSVLFFYPPAGSSYSFDVHVISHFSPFQKYWGKQSAITCNWELLYLNKSSAQYVKRAEMGSSKLAELFPKEATTPAHTHLGPSEGSEEQCWDRLCQRLLRSHPGPLPEVMLGLSHIQPWGQWTHRPVFVFPLKGFTFFFLH